MTFVDLLIVLASMLFALVRVFNKPTQSRLFNSYKAFAHIWVGFLIGAYCAGGEQVYMLCAVTISVIELMTFLVGRIKTRGEQ